MPQGVGALTVWVVAHVSDLGHVRARRKSQREKSTAASHYHAPVRDSQGCADV